MKTCWFILSIVLVLSTAPICRADDGLKFKENGLEDITANSAKWQSLLRKWRLEEQANKRKAAAYVVEREKQKKLGRDLFGVDERWAKAITGKEDFSGAVAVKSPRDFQVGDWGCHDLLYTVVQRVEPDTALVCLERFTDEPMLLKGLDFSKVVDGTKFILQRPILISGTESYETVAGGSKTVFRIECDLKKVEAQALLEANAGYRVWTSSNGKHTIRAKLIDATGSRVTLQTKDGVQFSDKSEKLTPEDRKYIREQNAKD